MAIAVPHIGCAPVHEQIIPLKPSDALRVGALYLPQCFRQIFEFAGDDPYVAEVTKACALGTIWLTYGYRPGQRSSIAVGYHLARIEHEMQNHLIPNCPANRVWCRSWRRKLGYGDAERTVKKMVTHLNDEHEWTREKIANWLESVGH